MTIRFFQAADGACLAYRDEGEGLPVLCLSGLTRDMHDFDYLAANLDGIRLIRMDYRGRGASEWTGAASYTVLQEGADALALLDHLGIEKAALVGTSRGGLIGMYLAAVAKHRLIGVCLNDVGPKLEADGLRAIMTYLGKPPAAKTMAVAAKALAETPGFGPVPEGRWENEAAIRYRPTKDGLDLSYDPALRDAFLGAMDNLDATAWPLFDAMAGLPCCLLRGAGSDLLSAETAAEMRRRNPAMIYAEVADRAHIPFLDENSSLAAIRQWLDACA